MISTVKISQESASPLVELDAIEAVCGWTNKGKTKERGRGAWRQRAASLMGRIPGVDLDAAAMLFNADSRVVRCCYVDDPDPYRGAIVHGGDDTGRAKESSERIAITLSLMPDTIKAIVLSLTSFTGAGFDEVLGTSFVLLNNGAQVGATDIPIDEPGNAALLTVIRRQPETWTAWEIQEIGRVVRVSPGLEGNRDDQVNWKDLASQHRHLMRLS